MGGKIGFILIMIVIVGIAIYVLQSGFLQNGASSLGSVFHFPTSTAESPSNLSGYTSPTGGGTYIGPGPSSGGSGSGSSGGTQTINPADIPAGYTAAQLSPYFQELRFGSVGAGGGSYYGQISINADYLPANESVDVTGWEIKTNRGGEYIPQAVNVYNPEGSAPESDIRLKNNDVLNIYDDSAPVNLRLNECLGYLNDTNQFVPGFPLTCPGVNESQIQTFTGACQNYINSIGTCSPGDPNNPAVPRYDYQCQDYIENNFSYNACFEAHGSDPNFLSNEVRVWTGSSPLDPDHDTVLLLDGNGLLVDLYKY